MKKQRSVGRQILVSLCWIIVGAIALCWIANTTLLGSFYTMNKQKSMAESFQIMSDASANGTLETSEFDVTFENICYNRNIKCVVLQPNGYVVRSSVSNSSSMRELLNNTVFSNDFFTYLDDEHDYQILRKYDTRLDSEYLVLMGTLNNGELILMQTALESIRESVDVANRFLLIVGLIMIGISILVGKLMTDRISQPVRQLTDISKRMVNLDFEAKYVQDDTKRIPKEIALLGEHFNSMSMELERTISELKTANAELQNDIEKKTQIDEMRKEFLSNVSHELKTPLALISGYAEGLQECINEDEESREFYCDVIIDETRKMTNMVGKLLTLNQLEFGNEQVNMERFNITELISGILNSTHILLEQKGAVVQFDDTEEAYVWGDEFMVEEVVTNYLSNALNHLDGEKQIRIFYTKMENMTRISIFNNGAQIPEADLEQIWTKFYKVDKARTRAYGGSGIGLSIVKAIMDSMHQECGAINHDDGVEFWFELSSR